ncbi:MAG: hypothetical protein N3D75_03745 [Candidatus Aenigmarchaeota archaeon]|nr:hypothetical protein [Candidatus Aenigmarchaeota archaeon]
MVSKGLRMFFATCVLGYSLYLLQAPSSEAIPITAQNDVVTIFVSGDRICSGELVDGQLQTIRHCFSEAAIIDYSVSFYNGELQRLELPQIEELSDNIIGVFSYTNPIYEIDNLDLSDLSVFSIEIPTPYRINENSFFKRMNAAFLAKKGNETYVGFHVPELTGKAKKIVIEKRYNYFGMGDSGMPVYAIVEKDGVREIIKIGHISAQYGKSHGERVAHRGNNLNFYVLYGEIDQSRYYQVIKVK